MKLRLMMIYGMKLRIYLGFVGFIAETNDDWKLVFAFPFVVYLEDTFRSFGC